MNIDHLNPEDLFSSLTDWCIQNRNIRAMVLTGSRAQPGAVTDRLSDFDIQFYVRDISPFMNDDWMNFLGNIMIRWPLEPAPAFSEHWITRLIIFTNGTRFDFQLTSLNVPDYSTLSHGYKIIIDKDQSFNNPGIVKISDLSLNVPDEKKFLNLVNAFFWDATYVAKCLKRDELFYAKYMFDSNLRFSKLQIMLEWYIRIKNDGPVNTNKYGRFFKKYLSGGSWNEIESTFAGANIEDNWNALFNMMKLFGNLAKEIARFYGSAYPGETDSSVTAYCEKIKTAIL